MHPIPKPRTSVRPTGRLSAALVSGLAAFASMTIACGGADPPAEPVAAATPVYNQTTGRLEQLISDRDGDGTPDTWAFMDGTRLLRIEIDRDGDGAADRWEFYEAAPGTAAGTAIARAEEAGGAGAPVTRREFYTRGVLDRVEEDTDLDGRVDKWEAYADGRLTQVDLDLSGAGRPTRRMVYAADGSVARMEADADGDGVFSPVPAGGGRR
jgi:hypothetical protein